MTSFENLPALVRLKIFNNLSLMDRLMAENVCAGWRDLVQVSYRDVTAFTYSFGLDDKLPNRFTLALSKIAGTVRTVTLSGNCWSVRAAVMQRLQNADYLQVLSLSVRGSIPADFFAFLGHLPTRITRLRIRLEGEKDFGSFEQFQLEPDQLAPGWLCRLRRLQSLALYMTSNLIVHKPVILPRLRRLEISGCLPFEFQSSHSCPRLETFAVTNNYCETLVNLRSVARFTNIRKLYLHGEAATFSLKDIVVALQPLDQLRSFYIHCLKVTRDDSPEPIPILDRLEQLDIQFICTELMFTEDNFFTRLCSGKRLRSVRFSPMRNMSGIAPREEVLSAALRATSGELEQLVLVDCDLPPLIFAWLCQHRPHLRRLNIGPIPRNDVESGLKIRYFSMLEHGQLPTLEIQTAQPDHFLAPSNRIPLHQLKIRLR